MSYDKLLDDVYNSDAYTRDMIILFLPSSNNTICLDNRFTFHIYDEYDERVNYPDNVIVFHPEFTIDNARDYEGSSLILIDERKIPENYISIINPIKYITK